MLMTLIVATCVGAVGLATYVTVWVVTWPLRQRSLSRHTY